MATNSTSFTNTPQAGDDAYSLGEDALLSSTVGYNIISLDVMSNDLGGNAKKLYSIDDGNGNPLASDAQLLVKDVGTNGISVWETTEHGNQVRINNGKIEFDVNHSLSLLNATDINSLAAGEAIDDDFVYTIQLGNGTLSQAHVHVHIDGQNDASSFAPGGDAGTAYEDGASASGTLLVNDLDHGEAHTHSGGGTTALGSYTVNDAGQWSYTADHDANNHLAVGVKAYDSFVVDSQDGSAHVTVNVTIVGTNDAPTITSLAQSDSASEGDDGSSMTASGQVTYSDVDVGDSHTFTVSAAAAHGTAGVDAHGNWTYAVSDTGDVNALAVGEHLSDSFTVQVDDGNGGTATQVVNIDIVGTNDAPTVSGSVSGGEVSEDAGLQTINLLADASDVDHGAVLHVEEVSALPAGVTLDGNSLLVDPNAYDSLAQGESQQIQVSYNVVDEHGASVAESASITIDGANDAPVITSAAQSGSVSEGDPTHGSNMTATGQVTYSDVDLSDTHTFTVSAAAAHGTAGVDADGTWSYTVTDSGTVDALAVGEHLADSFTVQVDDGHGGTATQVVSIDIVGTNDAPVITSAAQSGNVSEGDPTHGSNMTATGQVTYSDVDTSDTHSYSVSAAAAHGTAGVDADGNWSYTVTDSGAVDALAVGEHLSDGFTVQVDDGHGGTATQVVSIDIVGTNDAPVITSAAQSGSVSEGDPTHGSSMTASGQVTASDVDSSDSHSYSVSAAAAHGTAGVDADGNWSYTVTDSGTVDALAVGEHLADSFTVQVDDGHGGTDTQVVSIDIVGTNDAPVITSAAQSGSVSEGDPTHGASMTATGQVTYSDVDTSDTHTFTVSAAAAHGTAGVDADGNWSYTVTDSGAVDALAVGEHLADSFTVQVDDGHGGTDTQVVSIDIVGTNDAPVIISAVQSGTVSEGDPTHGSNMTAAGLVTYSDVDVGDSHTFSVSAAAAHGTASVDADGNWSYTVTDSANVDALAVGEHLADSFTVQVDDGHGGTATQVVSIDIVGTNDAPVISGTASGIVTEAGSGNGGGTPTVSGSLLVSDSDHDQSFAQAVVSPTASDHGYGTFTVDASGQWSYTLDNANSTVNALNSGQTLSDSFSVSSLDGTGHQLVTVTINGANDGNLPPLAHDDAWIVSQSTAVQMPLAALLGNDSDPDGGTLVVTGLSSNGSTWSDTSITTGNGTGISVSPAGITLNEGNHTGSDGFWYRISDGQGGTATGHVSIDIVAVQNGQTSDVIDISGDTYDYSYIASAGGDDSDTGGSGVDYLIGGANNDILVGNGGNDVLTGGNGNDTFKYSALGDRTDTITDFQMSTQKNGANDVLNLHDLLTSINAPHDSSAFTNGYLQLVTSGGSTAVMVDSDGAAGATSAVLLVTLTNAVLTQADTQNYTL